MASEARRWVVPGNIASARASTGNIATAGRAAVLRAPHGGVTALEIAGRTSSLYGSQGDVSSFLSALEEAKRSAGIGSSDRGCEAFASDVDLLVRLTSNVTGDRKVCIARGAGQRQIKLLDGAEN